MTKLGALKLSTLVFIRTKFPNKFVVQTFTPDGYYYIFASLCPNGNLPSHAKREEIMAATYKPDNVIHFYCPEK